MKSKLSTTKGGGKLCPSLDADLAKWCAALASPATPDEVPTGYYTAVELADTLGKNRNSINRQLGELVKTGRAEVKKFRIQTGQRGLYPTPHYRLLKANERLQ
jgi:hypothetical protein